MMSVGENVTALFVAVVEYGRKQDVVFVHDGVDRDGDLKDGRDELESDRIETRGFGIGSIVGKNSCVAYEEFKRRRKGLRKGDGTFSW